MLRAGNIRAVSQENLRISAIVVVVITIFVLNVIIRGVIVVSLIKRLIIVVILGYCVSYISSDRSLGILGLALLLLVIRTVGKY